MKILITESQYKKLKKHIKNQERLEEVSMKNLAATAAIVGSSLFGSPAKGQTTNSFQNSQQKIVNVNDTVKVNNINDLINLIKTNPQNFIDSINKAYNNDNEFVNKLNLEKIFFNSSGRYTDSYDTLQQFRTDNDIKNGDVVVNSVTIPELKNLPIKNKEHYNQIMNKYKGKGTILAFSTNPSKIWKAVDTLFSYMGSDRFENKIQKYYNIK
jgi:hypothetical protein